jgi:6-phosphogluconolactonase (cycloisomerase 2 family)
MAIDLRLTHSDLFIVANDNHDLGEISSFRYDASAENMTLLDRVYSNGSCAHLAISPDGETVYVANLYGNGAQGSNAALIPLNGEYLERIPMCRE